MTAPIGNDDAPVDAKPIDLPGAVRFDRSLSTKDGRVQFDVSLPPDATEWMLMVDSALPPEVAVYCEFDFSPDGGKTWASQDRGRQMDPFPFDGTMQGGDTMGKGQQAGPRDRYYHGRKFRPRHLTGGAPVLRVSVTSIGDVELPVPVSVLYTSLGEKAIDENDEPLGASTPASEFVG